MAGKRQLRKMMSIGMFFLMMMMSIGMTAFAEEASVQLDIDSLNLEVGVSTTLTLTVENMKGAKLNSIEGIESFDVLSSQQSSNTQIVNNQSSYQIQLNFELMPKAEGDYQLVGSVTNDGKTYKTNVLKVHVGAKSTSTADESSDLFVKTFLSKEAAYFGEKLILVYELYSRYNIEDFGFVDEVKLDGFITKDIPSDQLQASYVTIDGNKYVKYTVKKTILTPITAGIIKIPAYILQVNVSTGDFFSQSKAVYLNTEEKEVAVQQLPEDQKPSNFTGLVGQLEVKAEYSADEVDYGNSITLQVTLSGDCNLEILDAIDTSTHSGLTKYETEKDLKEDVTNNEYSVQKEFEVILVPQTTGEVIIEPISLSYFDTKEKLYKEAIIPGKTIQVNGEMPLSSTLTTEPNVNTEIGTAPATILISQINTTQGNQKYFMVKKNDVYGAISGILLLLLLLGILLTIRQKKINQDKQLPQLYKRIQKIDDPNACYDILNEMIKIQYQMSLKASSRSEIQKQISDEVVVKHVFDVMDYMESRHRNVGDRSFNLKDCIKKIYKQMK